MEIKYDENEEETETKRRDILKSYFAIFIVLGKLEILVVKFI